MLRSCCLRLLLEEVFFFEGEGKGERERRKRMTWFGGKRRGDKHSLASLSTVSFDQQRSGKLLGLGGCLGWRRKRNVRSDLREEGWRDVLGKDMPGKDCAASRLWDNDVVDLVTEVPERVSIVYDLLEMGTFMNVCEDRYYDFKMSRRSIGSTKGRRGRGRRGEEDDDEDGPITAINDRGQTFNVKNMLLPFRIRK